MKALCEEYTKCTIRNMIQALEYQRDKLWDDREYYVKSGNQEEFDELNAALTTMIKALSL
jgi:hypothetical protein